ncbi:MAG: hypothetical protein PHI55_05625 [Burkholderiaceae bacterium]|nr:hypothetical protein [Burkholderiaceae bacterium]
MNNLKVRVYEFIAVYDGEIVFANEKRSVVEDFIKNSERNLRLAKLMLDGSFFYFDD